MEIGRRLDRIVSELSEQVVGEGRVGEEINSLCVELERLREFVETAASTFGRQSGGPPV
jgi:hypothetical protein